MDESALTTGTNSKTPEYLKGYGDATAVHKRDLANALRIHSGASALGPEGETLSDQQVREIFIAVHGVMAVDDEFGPEPTGVPDMARISTYMNVEDM